MAPASRLSRMSDVQLKCVLFALYAVMLLDAVSNYWTWHHKVPTTKCELASDADSQVISCSNAKSSLIGPYRFPVLSRWNDAVAVTVHEGVNKSVAAEWADVGVRVACSLEAVCLTNEARHNVYAAKDRILLLPVIPCDQPLLFFGLNTSTVPTISVSVCYQDSGDIMRRVAATMVIVGLVIWYGCLEVRRAGGLSAPKPLGFRTAMLLCACLVIDTSVFWAIRLCLGFSPGSFWLFLELSSRMLCANNMIFRFLPQTVWMDCFYSINQELHDLRAPTRCHWSSSKWDLPFRTVSFLMLFYWLSSIFSLVANHDFTEVGFVTNAMYLEALKLDDWIKAFALLMFLMIAARWFHVKGTITYTPGSHVRAPSTVFAFMSCIYWTHYMCWFVMLFVSDVSESTQGNVDESVSDDQMIFLDKYYSAWQAWVVLPHGIGTAGPITEKLLGLCYVAVITLVFSSGYTSRHTTVENAFARLPVKIRTLRHLMHCSYVPYRISEFGENAASEDSRKCSDVRCAFADNEEDLLLEGFSLQYHCIDESLDLHASVVLWDCPESAFPELFENSFILVVAFRGTVSMENWKTDFKVGRVSESSLTEAARTRNLLTQRDSKWGRTVEVHSGFAEGLEALNNKGLDAKVKELIAEHRPKMVWFVGHSLGGALATLAAVKMASSQDAPSPDDPLVLNEGPQPCMFTVAAPRVGNRAFSKLAQKVLPKEGLIRCVADSDPITATPHTGFCTAALGPYKHVPGLLHVSSIGQIIFEPTILERGLVIGMPTVLRPHLKIFQYVCFGKNALQHMIGYYSSCLKTAEEVEVAIAEDELHEARRASTRGSLYAHDQDQLLLAQCVEHGVELEMEPSRGPSLASLTAP